MNSLSKVFKKVLLTSCNIFIILIFTNLLCYSRDFSWYSFNIKNAVVNLAQIVKSSYILDPPAGKHGFVIVKNGKFYFEDGTPAKFWGFNLVFGACFPNHQQAEEIAKFLAYLGVNLVRLHSMDRWLEPDGIWDKKDPTRISPVQLDKLDYFIYCLKKEGIYIDLNLLVTRDFSKIDPKFRGLALGGKPACLFDPDLIELQKEYARALLLHYNPYTKTTYNNEPAIAFIEIVNECSLFHYWFMGVLDGFSRPRIKLSYYFRKELDELWKKWLIKKYKDIANIPWNINFLTKNQPKFILKRPIFKLRFLYPKEEVVNLMKFYYDLEKKYFYNMKNYLKNILKIKSLILTTNSQYCLLNLMIQRKIGDYLDFHFEWDHPRFPNGKWNMKHFKFTNNNPLEEGEKNWVKIFAGVLVEGKPIMVSEWGVNNFNKYAYTIPLLFTTYASILNVNGLIAFNFWDKNFNNEISYIPDFFSFKNNPQKLALFVPCGIAFMHDYIKEKLVFKIKYFSFKDALNYVYKYGRDIPFQFYRNNYTLVVQKLSFNPKFQNKDIIFNSSKTGFVKIDWDVKNKIFKLQGNYIEGVTGILSKIQYIKLNYLEINSKTDGTVVLISLDNQPLYQSKKLLLTVVGEVKNSGASWNPHKFILGYSPVLLKRMQIKIKLNLFKNFWLIPIKDNNIQSEKYFYQSNEWISLYNFNTPWFIIEIK